MVSQRILFFLLSILLSIQTSIHTLIHISIYPSILSLFKIIIIQNDSFFIPKFKSEKKQSCFGWRDGDEEAHHWPHPPFSPLLPPGSIAEALPYTLWDSVEFRRKMSSKEMKWLIHEWLLEQLEFYRSSWLSAVLFYIQTTEFN